MPVTTPTTRWFRRIELPNVRPIPARTPREAVRFERRPDLFVETDASGAELDADPPTTNDPKAAWVAYAEARGHDNPDELTKAELVELYGRS